MVIWERILLPDNQTVTINSYGADAVGQAGVKGHVDSHFFQRFGSATLISVMGVAPTLATAAMNGHHNSNGTSSVTTINTLADPVSQNLQSSLNGVIGDYLRRPPTIGVYQGANITIFVDRDLEIF
jgi:type IV secretion system protein VirB10